MVRARFGKVVFTKDAKQQIQVTYGMAAGVHQPAMSSFRHRNAFHGVEPFGAATDVWAIDLQCLGVEFLNSHHTKPPFQLSELKYVRDMPRFNCSIRLEIPLSGKSSLMMVLTCASLHFLHDLLIYLLVAACAAI